MTIEELHLELRSLHLLTRRREDELRELGHENHLVLKGQREMIRAILAAIAARDVRRIYVHLRPL